MDAPLYQTFNILNESIFIFKEDLTLNINFTYNNKKSVIKLEDNGNNYN